MLVADDACSDVKADLKAGNYTNYTSSFPIYIEDEDPFEGGNVYIILKDGTRDPVQTVDGTVLYTKRGCTLHLVANSVSNRDALYLDVETILIDTERGYILKRGRDQPYHKEKFSLTIMVTMLL